MNQFFKQTKVLSCTIKKEIIIIIIVDQLLGGEKLPSAHSEANLYRNGCAFEHARTIPQMLKRLWDLTSNSPIHIHDSVVDPLNDIHTTFAENLLKPYFVPNGRYKKIMDGVETYPAVDWMECGRCKTDIPIPFMSTHTNLRLCSSLLTPKGVDISILKVSILPRYTGEWILLTRGLKGTYIFVRFMNNLEIYFTHRFLNVPKTDLNSLHFKITFYAVSEKYKWKRLHDVYLKMSKRCAKLRIGFNKPESTTMQIRTEIILMKKT